MLVETTISELTIEAFHIHILGRFARLYKV